MYSGAEVSIAMLFWYDAEATHAEKICLEFQARKNEKLKSLLLTANQLPRSDPIPTIHPACQSG